MLRVLIADDEEPARSRLRKLLQPVVDAGRITISAEAVDGVEVLNILEQNAIDLLLLDIQMPGLDGFEVLERIEPARRPTVVFTTAYDRYALQAFEASAVDYLLKPIPADRLLDAITRVERLRPVRDDPRVARLLDWIDTQSESRPQPGHPEPGKHLRQISISHRDRILVIPVARLVSADVSEGITRLHVIEDTVQQTKPRLHAHVTGYTLDQLEENLDPEQFMRVHRSAIVQIDHISEMIPWFSGRYKLILSGGHEVIASRERSRVLRERMLL